MKPLTTGILAHVDAGKTTCVESMLLTAGALRKAGRVDHQDSFLDYDEQERVRKITIYSKQAGLDWNDRSICVIDTPGHADFSAEMERALSVLDTAIVLISALDGVQSHTRTIWKCLDAYQVPAILFVNKMDITVHSRKALLEDLQSSLSEAIVDLSADDVIEQFAALDETLLEEYAETGTLRPEAVADLVRSRKAFPVLFGSALKNESIHELLDVLTQFSPAADYPTQFGARVFKVAGEPSNPLTHLKLTGGTLKVRDEIEGQKISRIATANGQSLKTIPEAQAGMMVVIQGISGLHPGQGLGFESDQSEPLLSASLNYDLILPDGCDPVGMMASLRALSMEDPSLHIEFHEDSQSISIRLMGEIQKEILKKRIEERTGILVEFGAGKIVYLETIAAPVFGYGHFEPLRHYAEVHLLLEPAKRGTGLTFSSKIGRDVLSLNWQRLILSALADHPTRGILTGSALTDVHVSLVAARAHQKHTQGGDFRQAASRAIRQALKKAENVLLEPYFALTIETPADDLSRILFELEQRGATLSVSQEENGLMKISGRGPVRTLINFAGDLQSLSRGRARLTLENDGYDVCTHAEEVIESIGYQDELDRYHPSGSVFCAQGAGYTVPWDEVEEHLHIPPVSDCANVPLQAVNSGKVSAQELAQVLASVSGANRNSKKAGSKVRRTELSLEPVHVSESRHLPRVLLVDGYNMIYSWPSLQEARSHSLFMAREELISRLINYQGFKGYSLIVVFDGNRRRDNPGSGSTRGNAKIVYTSTGISADAYIEKKAAQLKGKFEVIAATSDALIQTSVLLHGAKRLSARELEKAVLSVGETMNRKDGLVNETF